MQRHRLYYGHYSEVFVVPKNTQNAEIKCQSGAVPILLLALSASTTSAYSSLGVLQGLNPRRQLLKVSVYHSATSTGSTGVGSANEEAHCEGLEIFRGMPGSDHSLPIFLAIFGCGTSILWNEPVKHVEKDSAWLFHADPLVCLTNRIW